MGIIFLIVLNILMFGVLIDFDTYIVITNFFMLEVARQLDIPLTGDYKENNRYFHTNLTIHF